MSGVSRLSAKLCSSMRILGSFLDASSIRLKYQTVKSEVVFNLQGQFEGLIKVEDVGSFFR